MTTPMGGDVGEAMSDEAEAGVALTPAEAAKAWVAARKVELLAHAKAKEAWRVARDAWEAALKGGL
jgi:hypothetical protein